MNIENKVAIVTGGSSGLGEATVRQLVAQQARVSIFDVNESASERITNELGAEKVAFYKVDVSDDLAVQAAVSETQQRFGSIHICCNFAGILLPEKTFGQSGVCSLDSFSKTIQVNLIGTFNVLRHAAQAMSNNPQLDPNDCRGVIINTASVAAYEGQIGQAAYSASKAGIVGMTLPIARDLAPLGIRVNTIAPGIIHTPIFDGVKEEIYQSLQQQVLFPKRLGKPAEIAELAQHIIENDYLNGETIRIDGAIRMQPR